MAVAGAGVGTSLLGNTGLFLGGVGSGLGGIANIYGAITGIKTGKKQVKIAEQALNEQIAQNKVENQRYNELNTERKKANEEIAGSANFFERE